MIRRRTYRHLDVDSKILVEIDLVKAARMIDQMNYGTQRFLSHLVDVRREAHARRIKDYEARGEHEAAEYVRHEGDKLAEGIAKLLEAGLF